MDNLTEALKSALQMEKEGYDVYMSAAKKTKNTFGRLTLETIAKKELDHMRAIENYAKDIDRATALIAPVTKGELINLIMKGLKAELEKKAEAELDLTEAYRTGMALEKKSYNYYEQMMLKASDPKERRFFIFLMGQEETHYELLAETLQYLDKTGDWYREQERWNVD